MSCQPRDATRWTDKVSYWDAVLEVLSRLIVAPESVWHRCDVCEVCDLETHGDMLSIRGRKDSSNWSLTSWSAGNDVWWGHEPNIGQCCTRCLNMLREWEKSTAGLRGEFMPSVTDRTCLAYTYDINTKQCYIKYCKSTVILQQSKFQNPSFLYWMLGSDFLVKQLFSTAII